MTLQIAKPDNLGRIVREVWVAYCKETGHVAKAGHIAPWEALDEWAREADRRIGVAVANAILDAAAEVCERRRQHHRDEIERGTGSNLHGKIVSAKVREAQDCATEIRNMDIPKLEALLEAYR